MSSLKQGKFVLENSDGQVTRTFLWEDGTAAVVFREDTRRVELAEPKELAQENIPHTVISKVSRTKIMKSPLRLGEFGTLRFIPKIEQLEPSVILPEENPERFKKILKFTAIGHLGVLAFIFLIGLVIYPWLKEEPQTVQVVRQVRLEKKKTPQPKTVAMSETKVRPTKAQANSNRSNKVKPKKYAQKRKTGKVAKKTKLRREVKVSQVGALGVLGGMKSGSRKSGGLNLNSVSNSSGSGISGRGGAGGNQRSLKGKGLVTASVGSGGAAQGAGGYGTRGKGGGRPGYGQMNMAGSSAGYFQPLEEEALIEGGLDRDQIAAVINRHKGQVIYCYEKGLQVKPNLSGRVTVDFVISPSGRVSRARASNSSLNFSQVESCIVGKLKGWKFPKPVGNVNVNVSYPFVLRRVSQG